MFFDRKIFITAALAIGTVLALPSCTSDLAEETTPAATIVSSKIAGNSDCAQKGILIVKFDESAIPVLEEHARHAAQTRSETTRSGLESVDCILERIGVTSFKRVFPVGNDEERTREAGLHRWYVLNFSPEADLDAAAKMLADVAQVKTIQYNTLVCKAYNSKVYPLTEDEMTSSTRAFVTAPFNDPQLKWQWHYINNGDIAIHESAKVGADINVAEAWKLTAGDPRVIVAIVDGGVKYTHPDLAANMWINLAEANGLPGVDDDGNGYVDDIYGYNFCTDSAQITWNLDESHGTHVAGTVAAVNNNGLGVAGIAGGTGHNDGARLMSCQIFDGESSAGDYQTALAIKYAADMGASVLQCSYGVTAMYATDAQFRMLEPLVVEALSYFQNKSNCDAVDGGIVIYASGNEGKPMASYPAAYRSVISVTSFGADFLPAYYTNYHLGCNIAAPGGEIFSSTDNRGGVLSTICSDAEDGNGADYGYIQGTSMACPHVSGVAALGLAYALKTGKHFTREEFTNLLLTSVNDIDSYITGSKVMNGKVVDLESTYRGEMGSGAVDAYRLLMQIEGTACLTAAKGKQQQISLTQVFGGNADNLTYVEPGFESSENDLERYGAEMSAEDMQRLGVEEKPRIVNGKLQIKCNNMGCAKIKIRAIAGGDRRGTDDWIGGIPVVREVAIIVRDTDSKRWM
ncbi:MAG: S8 family serine peptidase [Alistipes sp.]|nr:S8 family serine peptidase [Alistipes sp.]